MTATTEQIRDAHPGRSPRRRSRSTPRIPSRARGLTLIEALITLLVMTVGLLGMAALQMVGIQENGSAFRHSQATWYSYAIADRMRANMSAVESGAYGSPGSPESTSGATDCSSGSSCDCGAVGANCSAAEMADFDIYEWQQLLAPTGGDPVLANGVGTIEDIGNDRFRIRVLWDDDTRSGTDTEGCPSDNSITQTCVELTVQP